MKVPLKWLSEFVELDRSVEELAHLMTMAGLEVEAIEAVGELHAKVVTARIVEQRPHPNADKLTLCTVDSGEGCRQVVCGARNMKAGDKVVLALPGSKLPGGMKITKSKLRGEKSEGMLCSARELELGDGHDGIMILDADTPIGRSFSEVYVGADQVLEIGVTPDRADCLSVLGVARDVAALTGQPLKNPPESEFQPRQRVSPAKLSVESPNCKLYLGRVVSGVKVGPSPDWLAARLVAAGARPINCIVDATNHVLLERGQPIHAFDLDKLSGKHIIVRQAREGESLLCLDGEKRKLGTADLAICDEAGPVAIAGVMGGETSAVHDETTEILIEAAWFEPLPVRATSKRLGLHTDASHRFERNVDPEGVKAGMDAVTQLILELAGGEVVGELLEVRGELPSPPTIFMRPANVNALLGLNLTEDRMCQHLRALRMEVEPRDAGYDVQPPSYRLDVVGEAHLAEEIGRLEGYEQIGTTLPRVELRSPTRGPNRARIRRLVEFLASRGLQQTVHYSFTSPTFLETFGCVSGAEDARIVRLQNPISEEYSVMRNLILPGLLKTAIHNANRESPDLKIFEAGRVYEQGREGKKPSETHHLAVLMTGSRAPRAWTSDGTNVDLFDVKGVLDGVLSFLGLDGMAFEAARDISFLAPGQGWKVLVREREVGVIGTLHPEVGRRTGLGQPAFLLELDLEVLWQMDTPATRFAALPRFPAVERDLAILVDVGRSSDELTALIREHGGRRLERIQVFDLYRGSKIPKGKKSMAFNLVYRAENRTLVDSEVNESYDRIVEALRSRTGAELRA